MTEDEIVEQEYNKLVEAIIHEDVHAKIFVKTDESELFLYTMSPLGKQIRNHYKLWEKEYGEDIVQSKTLKIIRKVWQRAQENNLV